MTHALQTVLVDEAGQEDALQPSPALLQILDEVERASMPRPEPPQQPVPATRRTPRPFAYD